MLYGSYVLSGDCYLSDLFAQLTQLMAALPADKIASHSQIGKCHICFYIFGECLQVSPLTEKDRNRHPANLQLVRMQRP